MDHASFELLNFIFKDNPHHNVMTMLGYRSGSEDSQWPIEEAHRRFDQMGFHVKRFPIEPLSERDIQTWLKDTFKFSDDGLSPRLGNYRQDSVAFHSLSSSSLPNL